jgi:NCS1 family nucleobase:cation symporter-1
LKDFVDLLVIWIAPWCAIFLVDWVLRRYRYSPENLQRTDKTSIYWRSGGIHWPAIIAQLLGMLASLECLSGDLLVAEVAAHRELPLRRQPDARVRR